MQTPVRAERGDHAGGRVIVRFRDQEILEGTAVSLDFGRPDFELRVPGGGNSRAVLVSLPTVKCIVIERRSLDGWSADWPLQKVAVHFEDGEVIRGLLGEPPDRRQQGMVVTVVSPARDEVTVLGVPWTALKGVYYLRAWDESAVEAPEPQQPPLVDLLGQISSLQDLHRRGEIDDAEYEERRGDVLRRI